MLRFVCDENFDGHITRGLIRRKPDLDIVRVQDVGLLGADDPQILGWAAEQGRILLSHDRATMPDFVADRVLAGLKMPGVVLVSNRMSIGQAIEEIIYILEVASDTECEGIVIRLPL